MVLGIAGPLFLAVVVLGVDMKTMVTVMDASPLDPRPQCFQTALHLRRLRRRRRRNLPTTMSHLLGVYPQL
jgi:hypothetical protein